MVSIKERVPHSSLAMWLFIAGLCTVLVTSAGAQSYVSATGLPTFTTALPVHNGVINVANGNLYLNIPLGTFTQRGGKKVSLALTYNGRIYEVEDNGTSKQWGISSTSGWRVALGYTNGDVTAASVTFTPCGASGYYIYSNYEFTDGDGTTRTFPITTSSDDPGTPSGCTLPYPTTATGYAADSSGYFINAGGGTGTVFHPDGTTLVPADLNPVGGTADATDTNGNITAFDGQDWILTDTIGRTLLHAIYIDSPVPYGVPNSQNTGSTYSANWQYINATSNFGVSGITEFSGTIYVIKTITLPDGTHTYQFGYDSTGELNSVTLPTGGTVSLGYTNFTDGYGNDNRWVNSYTADGGTWSYTPQVISTCSPGTQNCQQKVTVTKPSGDSAVYTFTLNNYGSWNTYTAEYSGSPSGTLLRSTTLNYDFSQPNYIRLTSSVVTLPTPAGNISTRKAYYYDSQYYGNVTSIYEWKYYTGSMNPATPDRKYYWSYTPDSGVPNYTQYAAKNILNKVAVFTLQNGSSTQLAQTRSIYDSTTLTGISGIIGHDDTDYGTSDTIRGNVTVLERWLTGSTFLNTTSYYDTTGQVVKTVDQDNNTTTFSFTDSYFADNGSNPPSNYTPSGATNGFVTKTTLPITGTLTYGYYYGSGKTESSTDQNSQRTYFHFVDSFDRPTATYLPVVGSGGWTLLTYPSMTEADTYTGITSTTASTSCSSCQHNQQLLDTWGRVNRNEVVSDPEGATYTDTSYDTTSRVSAVTNPYRSTSDPTYGSDSRTYDGIDRVTAVTHTDGNAIHTYYGTAVTSHGGIGTQLCSTSTYGVGYPVLTVDEAGKKRQVWTDEHGKAIETDEPDSSNNLTVATCYQYDLLDNLTQVVQGSETRSYTYDALSRMTSETNPESGTTNYYYTNASGGLCSGDPNLVCRRTDARSITTTYTYDALNRLIGKSYSDGTPSVSYYYDQTSYNGLTITNGKGRRTGMSDASGQTAWSYDAMGRVLSEERTNSGITKTISYTYNLDGSLASIKYPSGRTITYAYGNARRPLSAIDSVNSINYSSSAKYAPTGALSSLVNGSVSGGFAGITRTYGYNNRLQFASAVVSSSNGTVQNLSYSYNLGSGVNNGDVASITNNLVTGRTQLFTYDYLNRIATAKSQATSGGDCWGLGYGYDRYGNLLTATVTQCSAPALSLTVNTSNHVTNSGFTYDAAGDVTADGSGNSYGYDAESRMKSAAGITYTIDGLGLRVKKSNGELDWFTPRSQSLLFETDSTGNITKEYVWFESMRIARRDSSGAVYYYFADGLGSGRVMTNSTGSVEQASDYYPFGGERVITNTIANDIKFTGKKRDSETGFDYSIARMFNSAWGRWLSPDPAGLRATDTKNPQTWNRYAYVLSRPLAGIDPQGLKTIMQIIGEGGGGVSPDWYLGFGGGDFGCTADLVDMPCGAVMGMLFSGGAVQCPNNVCLGVNKDNTPVQFVATTTSSYYSCTAAGSFGNQQSAGVAAVNCANGPSIATNTEYSGNVYEKGNGKYSFTLPSPGDAASSGWDPNAIPNSTWYAGSYHTHGAFDINYLNEQFSTPGCNGGQPCDIGLAMSPNNQAQPMYLGTPQGRVEVFDPMMQGMYPYGCVLVGGAVTPGPGTSSVPVPACP